LKNEKLLMHCMMHVTHGENTPLDRHIRQYERDVMEKTNAWRITERVVLVILLAVSSGFFYLLTLLNDALNAAR
jgi:hypothetical protein